MKSGLNIRIHHLPLGVQRGETLSQLLLNKNSLTFYMISNFHSEKQSGRDCKSTQFMWHVVHGACGRNVTGRERLDRGHLRGKITRLTLCRVNQDPVQAN